MYEVEVKVRADHEDVARELDEIGAERVDSVVQRDTYFDAPHRDFAETDEAVRVRRERDDGTRTSEITYKGPLVEDDSKTRAEIETRVRNGDDAVAILEALGFEPVATVEKDRERYRRGDLTITLDSVASLGEFVEVETDAETEADIHEARESAFELLRELGLDPDAQLRTSYLELLVEE